MSKTHTDRIAALKYNPQELREQIQQLKASVEAFEASTSMDGAASPEVSKHHKNASP